MSRNYDEDGEYIQLYIWAIYIYIYITYTPFLAEGNEIVSSNLLKIQDFCLWQIV